MLPDTVFILGAGFSKPAGIPLLRGFVQKMWEMAKKGHVVKGLSREDQQIFARAQTIREELDGYHGRARFDDWNIEDVLSLLSFNAIGGGRPERSKLESMTQAIARTVELTCSVKPHSYDSHNGEIQTTGPAIYRTFWRSLFGAMANGYHLPAIITFNYDLILERSLFQLLNGVSYKTADEVPLTSFQICYHHKSFGPLQYRILPRRYEIRGSDRVWSTHQGLGTSLESFSVEDDKPKIELLKLHGSLNFPAKKRESKEISIDTVVKNPYILPPVFNKLSGNDSNSMWTAALSRVRSAKNIVIVGYSLPQTDVYMQYFMKAAVGPNRNMQSITVFDPLLFEGTPASDSMRRRYESCFSDPLKERIEFEPSCKDGKVPPGTTEAFVHILATEPSRLLFSHSR